MITEVDDFTGVVSLLKEADDFTGVAGADLIVLPMAPLSLRTIAPAFSLLMVDGEWSCLDFLVFFFLISASDD